MAESKKPTKRELEIYFLSGYVQYPEIIKNAGNIPDFILEKVPSYAGPILRKAGLITKEHIQRCQGKFDWDATVAEMCPFLTESECYLWYYTVIKNVPRNADELLKLFDDFGFKKDINIDGLFLSVNDLELFIRHPDIGEDIINTTLAIYDDGNEDSPYILEGLAAIHQFLSSSEFTALDEIFKKPDILIKEFGFRC